MFDDTRVLQMRGLVDDALALCAELADDVAQDSAEHFILERFAEQMRLGTECLGRLDQPLPVVRPVK